MSKEKYIVTGMGVACPLGNNTEEYFGKIINGHSGISLIDCYDSSDQKIKYAGIVRDIEFSDYMTKTTLRRSGRATKLTIVSSRQAYEDANLDRLKKDSVAIIVASSMAETVKMLNYYDLLNKKGARRASPFFSLFTNDLMAGYAAIELGIKGINYGVSCSCASGNIAIINAISILKLFENIDAVIVCGTDAMINKEILEALYQTNMLANQVQIPPEKIMRPYDKLAQGIVVSEGSGAIVIERENTGATAPNQYVEICSYACNSDAFSMTLEAEDINCKVNLVNQALNLAEIEYNKIDYINGYGLSLNHVDLNELNLIKECFCQNGNEVLVSSTKSMLGHLFGASALLEVISVIMSINSSIIIPNINMVEPIVDYEGIHIAKKSIEKEIRYALKLSYASGNRNTALIFKNISN